MSRSWHSAKAVGHTFKDFFRLPGTAITVTALLVLPVLFNSLAGWGTLRSGFPDFRWAALWASVAFVSFLFGPWLIAAISIHTRRMATGEDADLGVVLVGAARRWPSVLGTQLLIFLLIVGAFALASVPALGVVLIILATGAGFLNAPAFIFLALAFLAGFTMLAGIVLVIFFRYQIAPVVASLEDKSPGEAMQRSRELMRGRWIDLLLLAILLALATGVVSAVIAGPAWLLTFGAGGFAGIATNVDLPVAILIAVSTYFAAVLTSILTNSSYANFYLGLRGDEVAGLAPSTAGQSAGNFATSSSDDRDSGEQQNSPRNDESGRNLPE